MNTNGNVKGKKLFCLDIETSCNVETCPHYKSSCDHALDPHRNHIDLIGIKSSSGINIFQTTEEMQAWLKAQPFNIALVGHNLKWDLTVLAAHGVDLRHLYEQDTEVMGSIYTKKVNEAYLEQYEIRRRELNKDIKKGHGHRAAKRTSLKTMAPFFLKVEPFWENTETHNDPEYLKKDLEHTYNLFYFLYERLQKEGSYKFYFERLMPIVRMLLDIQIEGIALDMELLPKLKKETEEKRNLAESTLLTKWSDGIKAWETLQKEELKKVYDEKLSTALKKAKDKEKCTARYLSLYEKAITKLETFNPRSPDQLSWLLKDYYKYDLKDFFDEESTGREVMEKLSGQGIEDAKLLLEYKEHTKTITSFLEPYEEKQVRGRLHTTYNPSNVRTGRLSSSSPNLQQVSEDLRQLFIVKDKDNYEMASFDFKAIEPTLIGYYTDDERLNNILANGYDFHNANTLVFFDGLSGCKIEDVKELYPNERKFSKELGLLLFYGGGWRRIQQSAIKYGFSWDEEKCRERYWAYHDAYRGVFEFKDTLDERFKDREIVWNILGRPLYFERQHDVHMKGFNTLIQSGGSDLNLWAALKTKQEIEQKSLDAKVLLLTHDETTIEYKKEIKQVIFEIAERNMTSFSLINSLGPVILKVERAEGYCWKKD